MIIVSDTTPIRYLVEIGKADILSSLFGRVLIPRQVFAELQGQKTPQVLFGVESGFAAHTILTFA